MLRTQVVSKFPWYYLYYLQLVNSGTFSTQLNQSILLISNHILAYVYKADGVGMSVQNFYQLNTVIDNKGTEKLRHWPLTTI